MKLPKALIWRSIIAVLAPSCSGSMSSSNHLLPGLCNVIHFGQWDISKYEASRHLKSSCLCGLHLSCCFSERWNNLDVNKTKLKCLMGTMTRNYVHCPIQQPVIIQQPDVYSQICRSTLDQPVHLPLPSMYQLTGEPPSWSTNVWTIIKW